MVQLALPARVVPQFVAEIAKSPVIERVMPVRVVLRLLLSVNVSGLLVVLTFCLPKLKLAGAIVADITAVPDRIMDWGLPGALSQCLWKGR
jgi:hypothetical protein